MLKQHFELKCIQTHVQCVFKNSGSMRVLCLTWLPLENSNASVRNEYNARRRLATALQPKSMVHGPQIQHCLHFLQ